MKLKIFDVVELNDKNRATILNIKNNEYLVEIVNSAGVSIGNKIIADKDINRIIIKKQKKEENNYSRYLLFMGKYLDLFFCKNLSHFKFFHHLYDIMCKVRWE